jgi:hypothetical protein
MYDITVKNKKEAALFLTAYGIACLVRGIAQPFRLAAWKAKGGKRHGPRPEIRP